MDNRAMTRVAVAATAVLAALLVASCASSPAPPSVLIAEYSRTGPRVAPMPFGDSMFGPWRTNGQPTQAPIVVGERIPAFTTVLWPVMNAHGWELTLGRDVILPDAVIVPARAMTDREFAIDWLLGLCREYGLRLSIAGNALSIRAAPTPLTDGVVSVEVLADGRVKVSCEHCDVVSVIKEVARKADVLTYIGEVPARTRTTRVAITERTWTVRDAMERLAQLAEMRLVVFENPDGTVASFHFTVIEK